MQRDSGLGDGYLYDPRQEITGYQQNGTVNLAAGTVSGAATTNNLTFDGCGNRTAVNGTAQSYNNMNQPTGGTFGYDNEGDLVSYNGWAYTHDAQNRLTNVTKGTTTAQFYYDGKNRQIARTISGVNTINVWDDWELIEEYGTGNVRTAAYLQGAHGPVKSLMSNVYFYQDELGSTSHIADSTGHLLEFYTYNLYGKPNYWDASGNPLTGSNPAYNVRDLFTGERYISEIGLYDLRNRFMSPDLGRFLQPDPIGFKGDASNLYRYCGNDWGNRTDPTGLVEGDVTSTARTDATPDSNGPDAGPRLMAQSARDRHCEFYARSFQADHVEVTGQAIGRNVDYAHADMGDKHDPNAPSRVIIVGSGPGDGGGTDYKLQPATAKGKLLAGDVASKEQVEVTRSPGIDPKTLKSNTSNNTYVHGSNGVIKDHVAATGTKGSTGDIYKSQSYRIWFKAKGAAEGYRYDVSTALQQHHKLEKGVNTANDLQLSGPNEG